MTTASVSGGGWASLWTSLSVPWRDGLLGGERDFHTSFLAFSLKIGPCQESGVQPGKGGASDGSTGVTLGRVPLQVGPQGRPTLRPHPEDPPALPGLHRSWPAGPRGPENTWLIMADESLSWEGDPWPMATESPWRGNQPG